MNPFKNATALMTLLFVSGTCLAESQTPPAPMGQMGMGSGKGMMSMSEEQQNEHLKAYQEHILKMHDLSNQILSEQDPVKKELLKTKQLELIKEHHAHMMQQRMQTRMQH